jgi:type II secretory pathway pseudopilin PulG
MKTRTSRAGKAAASRRAPGGFTYVALLAAVAILAVSAQALTELGSSTARADREADLLYRGQAYRDAIGRYVRARPDGTYPRALRDLLRDPRVPRVHHLRALYPDPMSEDGAWALVRSEDGGIAGVASTSQERPRRRAHFPPGLEHFADAEAYADWVFQHVPPAAPAAAQ